MSLTEATVYAATLAACISLLSLIFTLRGNRRLALLGEFGDERKEIRRRLKELAELLHRVETSVRRLVALAPQLNPDQLMLEATHTLAIVSDAFRATGEDKVIDFPKIVVTRSRLVRKKLTELFLELEMSDERRKNDVIRQKLDRLCDELSLEISECNSSIREEVAPK